MSDFVKVGTLDQFPENRTHQVTVKDRAICLAHVNGQVTAFDDSCTHAAALISGCAIEDGQVACPLHGAKFDVTTGDAKTLPATEPLLKHEVKLDGRDVYVKVNESA